MKIFFIRHGESTQNVYENYENYPDFLVPLTKKGTEQADQCGIFLKDYIKQNNLDLSNAMMYISPFERTKQTSNIINKYLNIKNRVEDPLIIERQYGLYDNLKYEEREKFPIPFKYGKWMDENDGRFYKKMPLGESPFDVYVRARLFLQTLQKDIEEGIENIFIVSHGMFLKTLQMAYFGYSVDWFNKTGYMSNCAVKLIEKIDEQNLDKGYIFNDEIKY